MLTPQNTEAIRRIEEAIGYTFNDKRLLVQVLTRKTYLKIDPEAPDNEVLEFYGDTLMNYHVTNYFMSKYAHMLDDGLFFMRTVEQFTDMRSHYVCNRYLTDRIKAMGLARYLRAQNRDAELRRDGEKAYADIFESLVGAIYLDSYQNDALIRAFILRQLGIEPKRQPEEIESFNYDALAYSIPTEAEPPEVLILPADEEPESPFDTPADLPAAAEDVTATPASEEAIEEAAAVETEAPLPTEVVAVAVAEEAVTVEAPTEVSPAVIPQEPVIPMPMQEALAEFCRKQGFEEPTYSETPKNAPNARPVAACTMKYKDAKGKMVKISLNDSGKTLAEATEKAAAKMLKKLERQVNDNARKAETALKESASAAPEAPVEAAPVAEPVDEVVAQVEQTVTDVAVAVAEMREAFAKVTDSVEVVTEPVADAEPVTEIIPPVDDEMDMEQLVMAVDEALPSVTTVETDEEAEPEAAPEIESAISEAPVEEVTEVPAEEVTEPKAEEAPAEEATIATEAESAPTAEESSAAETVSTEEAPVETAPAEAAPVEDPKPARAPRKRKTEVADGEKPPRKPSTRKKAAPKSETIAEEPTAPTEAVSEPVVEAAEAVAEATAPVKETKPRTRKPRAPKQTVPAEAPAAEEKVKPAE